MLNMLVNNGKKIACRQIGSVYCGKALGVQAIIGFLYNYTVINQPLIKTEKQTDKKMPFLLLFFMNEQLSLCNKK